MLRAFYLNNLVLVEEAYIEFHTGLTMITGETGAGKTALIEALHLLLGERADSTKIRKGCEKACVSATFDFLPSLLPLLERSGIDHDPSEDLILKREILSTGKSRAFVSGQRVPAALLQMLAPYLIDFVGQHAQVILKSNEQQLALLDQYAQVDPSFFRAAWKEEKELERTYQVLLASKTSSESKRAQLMAEKVELEEANIQKIDEEALFEEYSLLANAQELLAHTSAIISASEEATKQCVDIQKHLDSILRFDKSLQETCNMSKEAHLMLRELILTIESFQGKAESNPGRLSYLEERLKTLDRLKKKYGKDLATYLLSIENRLQGIENLEEKIATVELDLKLAQKKTSEEVGKLRKQREEGASSLAAQLSTSLQELNIPQAKVSISLTPVTRTSHGEDEASFCLRANLGEESAPVKDHSSGGELSRLLFSLKVILSKKAPTLIFDEIDANVGGETATIMGKKLKMLGKERQILCITHFPQVAKQADHHISVVKREEEGRTRTEIIPLDKLSKEKELLRMLGGISTATREVLD